MCASVCATCVQVPQRDQNRASNPLEPELQLVGCALPDLGAEIETQVSWKSNKCSKLWSISPAHLLYILKPSVSSSLRCPEYSFIHCPPKKKNEFDLRGMLTAY